MRKPSLILRLPRVAGLAAALVTALAVAVAAQAGAAPSSGYASHNLVSDQAGMADRVDPDLVNAWGLASRVDSPWWVANNATNQATVYTADGNAFAPSGPPLAVGVPESPTGAVANSGSSLAISAGGASAPALFLFGTEEGKILAWNQAVPSSQAVVAVDRSGAGAIYKVIDRLWALQFGHGAANNGPVNTLFFTAGPDDEARGLFGTITAG